MNSSSDPQWYAIHAKPAREAFAASKIERLGLDVYYPRLRSTRGGRTLVKPLFPGYFFARFAESIHMDPVRYAQGVLRVLCSGRLPVPIEDEVIAEMRSGADSMGCVTALDRVYRPGDRVLIEEGPLQGLIGRIAGEENDRRRVMILLETILHARVSVSRDCVSAMPAAA